METDRSNRVRERLDTVACGIVMTIMEARHQMSSESL